MASQQDIQDTFSSRLSHLFKYGEGTEAHILYFIFEVPPVFEKHKMEQAQVKEEIARQKGSEPQPEEQNLAQQTGDQEEQPRIVPQDVARQDDPENQPEELEILAQDVAEEPPRVMPQEVGEEQAEVQVDDLHIFAQEMTEEPPRDMAQEVLREEKPEDQPDFYQDLAQEMAALPQEEQDLEMDQENVPIANVHQQNESTSDNNTNTRSLLPTAEPKLNKRKRKRVKSSNKKPYDKVLGYTHIDHNIYSSEIKPKKREEENMCGCGSNATCSNSNCLNRASNVECTSNCGAKHCGNQQYEKMDYAPMEVFKMAGKGHGLRARKNIRKNTFLIEYAGEYIPEAEFLARKEEFEKSSKLHHYFLQVAPGIYIDASTYGNYSRFINHSCNPNALCDRWTVSGAKGQMVRIGFYALRNINAGDEITFDYGYSLAGLVSGGRFKSIPQRCLCGSDNCSGWIGGKGPDVPIVEENVLQNQNQNQKIRIRRQNQNQKIRIRRQNQNQKIRIKRQNALDLDVANKKRRKINIKKL